ncbi:MAG: hypothetical protein ACRBG0_06895 [Lewinella sp.]|uniref:hypothetical protein n=1 Tax=Lewinella sp. TaxID=2004506 RepID=UPI003D6B20BB
MASKLPIFSWMSCRIADKPGVLMVGLLDGWMDGWMGSPLTSGFCIGIPRG